MSTEWNCSRCNVSCNGCDSCNSCNIVIGLCSSNQKASSYLGEFKWGNSRTTLKQDDIFFTRNEWNSLISYIENAYQLGSQHSAWNTYQNTYNENIRANDNNEFMTAVMYNEAYRRMKNLSKDNRNTTYNIVEKDETIVTHELFNNLYSLANSFELHKYQCNGCNSCNSCQGGCNSCNSCQGGYTSYCCHTEAKT